MQTINIYVSGHKISTDGSIRISAGSNKFDKLKFTFDESWNGLTKYASLSRDKVNFTKLSLDSNNECLIEETQISNSGNLYIGAYGEGTGSTKATTALVRISIDKGSVMGIDPINASEMSSIISQLNYLKADLTKLTTASSSDVGKVLKVKTVVNGKVTEWEFAEAGSGESLAVADGRSY